MKKATLLLATALMLMVACGQRKEPTTDAGKWQPISMHKNAPGDSARYGLACDGCTDSVLVFLPYSGGDPDTFDIISAFQQRRIYGRMHIGDELAVIVNPEDSAEAVMVYNLETLKGTWCYMVTPTLRNIDKMPSRIRRRMIEHIPDSLRRQWLKPREYTLRLKRDNTAMHYGGGYRQTTTDEMSPVEYPKVTHYTEWRLYNGRLILKADTISGFSREGDKPKTDTADIVLLRDDSLVLRINDATQSYYRKDETSNHSNK